MAGFKDFSNGNVLDAGEIDEYLMGQSVPRFATAASLVSTLGSGIREKGMLAWADDTDTLYMYSGSGSTWKAMESLDKTPSLIAWTAATTNPVRGNGVEAASYRVSGGYIQAYWRFTMGTTSTAGTGNYAWGLPGPSAAEGQAAVLGTCVFFDSSASAYFVRSISNVGNVNSFILMNEAGVRTSSTVPATPAVGDIFQMNFRYRSTALDIS